VPSYLYLGCFLIDFG